MKIFIVCSKYLDLDGENKVIGGVETYIYKLINVIKKLKYEIIIYQFANKNFIKNENGVNIIGIKVNINESLRKNKLRLKKSINKDANLEKDILLFSTECINFKNNFKKSISIQHGVAWDISSDKEITKFENIIEIIRKMIGSIIKYNRFSYSKKMVCVDYNFLNWYRSQLKKIPENDMYIIPNVPDLPAMYRRKKDNGTLKIIFARRLCEYRGTKIFVEAIEKILTKYSNIEVTIAGEGPDEKYMRKVLAKFNKVRFIKYDISESLKIHQDHDIAIVPTKGSEGTSLSLLEAMACGCAVIGSNVGGITNVIIDNFNGLMISPNTKELYVAIERLIVDEELRFNLSIKARETVMIGFNNEKWESKWKFIFEEISNEDK